MKYLFSLLGVFCFGVMLAQVPQSFHYQAVARDAGGQLLDNQSVSFQLSIRQGSLTGTVVYQEIHPVTTNDFGLVNLEVGTGLVGLGTFSAIDWSNGPYFMEVGFDPSGGFAFSSMGGSELISVPYALRAASADNVDDADADPNNEIQDISLVGSDLSISGGSTVTLPSGGGSSTLDEAYDGGGGGAGRIITADQGAVEVNSATANGVAVDVNTSGLNAVGLRVRSTNASSTFSAIQAETNSTSTVASAIVGNTTGAAWAISGQVDPTATAEAAIYGSNLRTNGGHGVYGIGLNGVVGETNYSQGFGLFGENFDAIPPLGLSVGVAGTGFYGVLGEDRYLGSVPGAYGVFSNGELGSSGLKTFLIDHPADPENKMLKHFSVESNEVLNIYRGTVVCDENGEAFIQLPDYYDLINIEPSYQLTPIGAYAPVYIKDELSKGSFSIAGAEPGMKVSWTLTSVRNDPYLQKFPEKREVVIDKTERTKGKYFMPHLYGASKDKKITTSPEKQKKQKLNTK